MFVTFGSEIFVLAQARNIGQISPALHISPLISSYIKTSSDARRTPLNVVKCLWQSSQAFRWLQFEFNLPPFTLSALQ